MEVIVKFNKPIEIDLEAFLLEGKFNCIKLGQTKESILNNFPDPSNISKYGILAYGSLELYFTRPKSKSEKSKLYMIFSDDLERLKTFKGLNYTNCIFDSFSQLTLLTALQKLNSMSIDYSIHHNKNLEHVQLTIKESKVMLYFSPLTDEDLNYPNRYQMKSFCLTQDEY